MNITLLTSTVDSMSQDLLLVDSISFFPLLAFMFVGACSLRKWAVTPFLRMWFLFLGGFGLLFMIAGKNIIYSMLSVLVTYFSLRYLPQRWSHLPPVIFLCSMLLWLHICALTNQFSLPVHYGTIFICIRLAGFCFQWKEYSEKQIKTASNRPKYMASLTECASYAYCFLGAYMGPLFDYVSYRRFLNDPYMQKYYISPVIYDKAKRAIFYATVGLMLTYCFPMSTLRSHRFLYETSLPMQLIVVFLCCQSIPWIFASGFNIFDLIALIGTLGFKEFALRHDYPLFNSSFDDRPSLPANDKRSSDKISQNMTVNGIIDKHRMKYESRPIELLCDDEFSGISTMKFCGSLVDKEVLFPQSPTMMIRHWNKGVQEWLYVFVYKRLPVKSPLLRELITFSVSSFGHGLSPGFLSFFWMLPAVRRVETIIRDATPSRYRLSTIEKTNRFFYYMLKISACFATLLTMEYLSVNFMLKTFKDSWEFWKATKFVGVFVLFGLLFLKEIYSYCFPSKENISSDQRKKQ